MSTAEPAKVIAVVGMPGSGKGTFCDAAREGGWSVFAFRDMVERKAKELKIDKGPLTLKHVGDEMRKEIGPDWIAVEAAKAARASGAGLVCFDDSRTEEEVACLRKEFPRLKLVGIFADKPLRFQRILARKRWDDNVTVEILEHKENAGGAWGIPKLLEMADVRIENRGTLAEFKARARAVLSAL